MRAKNSQGGPAWLRFQKICAGVSPWIAPSRGWGLLAGLLPAPPVFLCGARLGYHQA